VSAAERPAKGSSSRRKFGGGEALRGLREVNFLGPGFEGKTPGNGSESEERESDLEVGALEVLCERFGDEFKPKRRNEGKKDWSERRFLAMDFGILNTN
jgi:hypothetical protein